MKDFDFRQPRTRRLRGMPLLATLALAALLASGAMLRQLEDEAEGLQQASSAVTPTLPVAPPAAIGAQAQAAAGILLGLPWSTLFADLDAALDERSALLELEPDADAASLRIVAESPDLAAMLAFVERLQGAGSLAQVELASHRVLLQETGQPVRYIVRARWRGIRAASTPADTALHTPAG